MSGLALGRRIGESIHIGDDIIVTVTQINGNQCRILVQAPPEVKILRGELLDREETMVSHRMDGMRPTAVLWPDGSQRPVPSYLHKPQNLWTSEESAQCANDQREHLAMLDRLQDQGGER